MGVLKQGVPGQTVGQRNLVIEKEKERRNRRKEEGMRQRDDRRGQKEERKTPSFELGAE